MAFAQHNLPLQERLERLLQVQSLVFVTTESVIDELSTLVEKSKDAEKKAVLQRAYDWMKENCSKQIDELPSASLDWAASKRGAEDHMEELSAAGRDLLTVLTDCNGIHHNDDVAEKVSPPLLVASQDESLLHLARQSGKVPVIRLARGSVLLLEQPSHVAQQSEQQAEREKWTVRGTVQDQERLLVDLVKQKERQEQRRTTAAPNPQERRKKRKAKEPNPLSCKQKKSEKTKSKKQKS
eukprot:scaffold578_cov167-Amphora_coffeaeformis.AAC.24